MVKLLAAVGIASPETMILLLGGQCGRWRLRPQFGSVSIRWCRRVASPSIRSGRLPRPVVAEIYRRGSGGVAALAKQRKQACGGVLVWRTVALAALRLRYCGEDLLDVHAAAAIGRLSAVAAGDALAHIGISFRGNRRPIGARHQGSGGDLGAHVVHVQAAYSADDLFQGGSG